MSRVRWTQLIFPPAPAASRVLVMDVEPLEAIMRVRTYSTGAPEEDQPDRIVPVGDVATREMRLVSRVTLRAEALGSVWSRLWRGLQG